ncbi:MAG: PIG-L family deacetylase [Armatimonadetes bacterium]|nr:MAG: PIG-L family deacetylase [Armatimonadota bacterium]
MTSELEIESGANDKASRKAIPFVRRVVRTALLTCFVIAVLYNWQPQRYGVQAEAVDPGERLTFADLGLFTSGKTALAVFGHPDDESFYMGGTLIRLANAGVRVHFVALTDGNKTYYPGNDSRQLAQIRRKEMRSVAHQVLAKSLTFFGRDDGRYRVDHRLVRDIQSKIEELRPDYLFLFEPEAPAQVYHKDHRNAGAATLEAARRARFSGRLLAYSTSTPNLAIDISDEWPRVDTLLATHASQFSGSRLELIRTLVFSRNYRDGENNGYELAETFRAFRLAER